MKVTNKELRRIIREERDRLLSEQDHTIERFTTTDYDDYAHGQPVEAASKILVAAEQFADVVAEALPLAGGALEPGMRATIIPTIMDLLHDRGVRVK